MHISSKLPNVGTTIFSVMSKLANETGAINLSQGFPDFDCDEKLIHLVHHYMKSSKNQYAPMPGVLSLRQAIANKVKRSYAWNGSADNVTITAGATQAIYTAITAVVKAGDEVIIVEPAYDCYAPAVELCGGVIRPYRLSAPDYRIDWGKFAPLISRKTKLIIFNNPHNPLGKTMDRNDLLQLQKLVEGTNILLLSDEVYEHLVFDGREHQSVLRFPELTKRSFVTFSFGKTLHATGWKMGYCIAPPALTAEFRKVHQFNVFSVHAPSQYALADYLQDSSTYEYLPVFFQQKRDFFAEAMRGSSLKPLPSEGTYFQLFDYSAISQASDIDFAKRMTTKFGVAVIPISVFYSDLKDEKVIRVCFAKKEETLEKAGKLLAKI